MIPVLTQTLRRRRTSLAWWALAVAGMCALLAVAYPTVRDNNELDKTFANLPPGVEALLGLSGGNLLTSPAGYLDSQFFANILPIMLLVFAVGLAGLDGGRRRGRGQPGTVAGQPGQPHPGGPGPARRPHPLAGGTRRRCACWRWPPWPRPPA